MIDMINESMKSIDGGLAMRLTSQNSVGKVLRSALGLIGLLTVGGCFSEENRARFYTYCDQVACYQCDAQGCRRMQGLPPGAVCRDNNDCSPGCYCGGGKCAEAGFCDQNSDCSRGYTCEVTRHSCVPGGGGTVPVTPRACRTTAECGAGGECLDGQCHAAPVLPNHCVFNRECGVGGACADGRCQKACQDDAGCGTGRTCQAGRCAPKADGGGACVASGQCGAAQSCLNGSCHPGCSKDADCQGRNAKDVCVAGLCRPDESRVPECRVNADCKGGAECVDSLCRTPCFASSDCAKCEDGPVCALGHCVSSREASPQCRLSAECGSSGSCTDGACAGN